VALEMQTKIRYCAERRTPTTIGGGEVKQPKMGTEATQLRSKIKLKIKGEYFKVKIFIENQK
jgi:hypothetical protein